MIKLIVRTTILQHIIKRVSISKNVGANFLFLESAKENQHNKKRK